MIVEQQNVDLPDRLNGETLLIGVDPMHHEHIAELLQSASCMYMDSEKRDHYIQETIMKGKLTDVICRWTGQSDLLTQAAYRGNLMPRSGWEDRAQWDITDVIATYIHSCVGRKPRAEGMHVRHGSLLLYEGQLKEFTQSLGIDTTHEKEYRGFEGYLNHAEGKLFQLAQARNPILNELEYDSANDFFKLMKKCVEMDPIRSYMPPPTV